MSVPVDLDELRAQVAGFGSAPYLLTVGDDGRPHSTSVPIAWDGDTLVAEGGRRTLANVAARPLVSLLWPPVEPGGYSLIVDAEATVRGSGEAARVAIRPTRGVLHRPAAAPVADAASCAHDCKPVLR